ncbi:hypothetical protein [Agriterribacter sp.]|uniref:hypothetical protein n=1 Tax=Agriterribacter sp. TaxID=2821509 RepID=UPI002C0394B2|nr:hypothetical protein [Agriterribacter sp.]HRP55979.1 hypothetical protein [Agriterribacter sp.]
MSNPRVMYAMSEDRVFPSIFLRRHPRTRALVPALTVIFVLSYFGIAVAVIISKPGAAVTGVCLLLLLAAIYFIFYYKKKQ